MKRLLEIALALLMVAVLLPVTAMAEEGEPAPVNGVWNVTPANAQDVLDGKYGSIDGTTIVFGAGEYDALTIGRVLADTKDNLTYTCNHTNEEHYSFTDLSEYKAHIAATGLGYHWTSTYTRTISNVTLVGSENVTIKGLLITSGHMYSTANPFREGQTGYYLNHKLTNFTFQNINFVGNVDINTSSIETTIDGFTFDGCSFTTNGTASSQGQALRYYNENNNGKVSNLTVKNCTFTNCYQGVYTGHIKNITVENSIFNTTGHNAIAIQDHGNTPCNHGAVVITGNQFNNVGDRIIRFNDVGVGTTITITNNTSANSGDSDGEIIKAQSRPTDVQVTMSGNNWGTVNEKEAKNGYGFEDVVNEPAEDLTNPGTITIIVPSTPTSPEFLSGANQTVGVGAKATFRIDKDFVDFMSVAVDGITLDKTQYKAWSGSTYVELLSSYMKTLSEGTHTLSAYFNGATATTAFTISKTVPAQQNPATGANDFVGAAAALAAVSLLGMAAITRKK